MGVLDLAARRDPVGLDIVLGPSDVGILGTPAGYQYLRHGRILNDAPDPEKYEGIARLAEGHPGPGEQPRQGIASRQPSPQRRSSEVGHQLSIEEELGLRLTSELCQRSGQPAASDVDLPARLIARPRRNRSRSDCDRDRDPVVQPAPRHAQYCFQTHPFWT
jgi:hypothetical protein